MQKTALITGITGQDGSYLAELLLEKGYKVWGLLRRSSSFNTSRIDHIFDDLYLRYGDLTDSSSLQAIINQSKPDEIYNLAAMSHVKVSFDMPSYTGDVCGIGVTNLLEAIMYAPEYPKFYQASSSELFGEVLEIPQTEKTPFNPRSPYAAAKAYAFYMTKNYREAYGLFAVNGICYNHESPRRGGTFVTKKISNAAASIKLGRQQFVTLGNLDAKRDWSYAKEMVYGMWQMMQLPKPDDYILSSGNNCSVRDFCEWCFEAIDMPLRWEGSGVHEIGIDKIGITRVKVHPKYFRPTEVESLLGDCSKAINDFGWSPKVTAKELAEIMVEADLRELTS